MCDDQTKRNTKPETKLIYIVINDIVLTIISFWTTDLDLMEQIRDF